MVEHFQSFVVNRNQANVFSLRNQPNHHHFQYMSVNRSIVSCFEEDIPYLERNDCIAKMPRLMLWDIKPLRPDSCL